METKMFTKKSISLNLPLIYFCACIVAIESDEQARLRFQVELEFVQCLANPNYLNCNFII